MDETTDNITYKEQFEAFLKIIRENKVEHWVNVAEALGVHQNTIVNWKKHPLAQKAIAEGIQHALEQMEKTGGRDWKMWREKLKMLGVEDKSGAKVAVGVTVPVNIDQSEVDYERLTEKVIGLVERLRAAGVSTSGPGGGEPGQGSPTAGNQEG
jgi:hypothetical protein